MDIPTRRVSLLSRPFGLGWRDRNKVSFNSHCIQCFIIITLPFHGYFIVAENLNLLTAIGETH